MSRNIPESVGSLHDLLASTFKGLLEGRRVIDKDTGEMVTIPPTSADLNVIRQFLKDNSVDLLSLMESRGDLAPVLDLVDELPKFDPDHFPTQPEDLEERTG